VSLSEEGLCVYKPVDEKDAGDSNRLFLIQSINFKKSR